MAPPYNMLYFAYIYEFKLFYGVDINIELIIPSRMIMNIYKKLLFHEKMPRLLTIPILDGRLDIVKQLLSPCHTKYIDLLTAKAAKYNHFDIVVYMFNTVETPSIFWLTLIIAAREIGHQSMVDYICKN